MATTTKSQTVSNPSSNSTQTGRTREDIPTLKNKVSELERQVNEYKTKLDELRRAKATTVIKLEKEYVNTTIPGLNRPEKSKPCEKCEEYERMIENERKSNTQLKKLVEQKENNKQPSSTNPSGPCKKCEDLKQLLDIEKENNIQLTQQLQNQKKQTEEERIAKQTLGRSLEMFQSEFLKAKNLCEILKKENEEYKDIFQAMKKEHQDKMEDLARREEDAKKQVATWEQMYREWMATMERRVNNLQVTNEELQTWIHNEDQTTEQHRSNPTRTQPR